MASLLNLENFVANIDSLPVEIPRNFKLMRDLHTRARKEMCDADKLADHLMSKLKAYSMDQRNEMLTSIQSQFDKAREYGDDKVQLAIQTYELVDKHIRQLDLDLAQLEEKMQNNAAGATRNVEEGTRKQGRKKTNGKETKKNSASSDEEAVTRTSKKKQLKKGGAKPKNTAVKKTPSVNVVSNSISPTNTVVKIAVVTGSLRGALGGATVAHSAEVFDMPVDPNEPTYCLCNQVSYGEMIGCDNPDCTIEWFHFACVKLSTKPKGKWFCPKCIISRKKK